MLTNAPPVEVKSAPNTRTAALVAASADFDGSAPETASAAVVNGFTVYVEPAKTVVMPLGARVMAGPWEVTTVTGDPSTVVTVA